MTDIWLGEKNMPEKNEKENRMAANSTYSKFMGRALRSR